MSIEKNFSTISNRWVRVQSNSTTTLSYSPQVNPSPLVASMPGVDPVVAWLEIVITNQSGRDLQVSEIDFNIMVGGAGSLTPTTAGIGCALGGSDGTWSITPPSSIITSGKATYSVTPVQGKSAPLRDRASLVVQIYNIQTNTVPGITTVEIVENIDSQPQGDGSFELTTFPSGFYFDSLSVNVPNLASWIPVAQVPFNTKVRLYWNASASDVKAVTVLQSTLDGQKSFPTDKLGEWDTMNPLQTDTVFTVQLVTTATPGGVPLVASLTTTVAVHKPVLAATSITVDGTSNLGGAVTAPSIAVSDVTASRSIATADLSSTGAATFKGGAVNVGTLSTDILKTSASAQIGSTMSVAALATLFGGLSVTGPSTLTGSLDVTGTVKFPGSLEPAGSVAIFSKVRTIAPAVYKAPSDALVMGYCSSPGVDNKACVSYVTGSTDGMKVTAVGGNIGGFKSNWDKVQSPNHGSFLMPVRRGAEFTISTENHKDNEVNAPTVFYWIPLGADVAPQWLRNAEPQLIPTRVRRVADSKRNLIGELADIIEALAGRPIPDSVRTRFRELLVRLTVDEYTEVNS